MKNRIDNGKWIIDNDKTSAVLSINYQLSIVNFSNYNF